MESANGTRATAVADEAMHAALAVRDKASSAAGEDVADKANVVNIEKIKVQSTLQCAQERREARIRELIESTGRVINKADRIKERNPAQSDHIANVKGEIEELAKHAVQYLETPYKLVMDECSAWAGQPWDNLTGPDL